MESTCIMMDDAGQDNKCIAGDNLHNENENLVDCEEIE